MWRGPVVQARKNAVNAVKWKVFSIQAKLISVAAQKWWNPDDNPSLAAAIYHAKKQWVPNDTIERAIKKWSGEDKDAAQIQEIIYEGYAPGGIALLISTLSDNKNRSVANIRHIFSKYGGNMWESWTVSWMFHKKWIIFIAPDLYTLEEMEEIAIELDAEDILKEAGYIKIICHLDNFHHIEQQLRAKNIELFESKIDYIYDNEIEILDFDTVLKFTKMLEAFDADEDVNTVSSNEVIDPDLQQQVDDFIEKNSFRT